MKFIEQRKLISPSMTCVFYRHWFHYKKGNILREIVVDIYSLGDPLTPKLALEEATQSAIKQWKKDMVA